MNGQYVSRTSVTKPDVANKMMLILGSRSTSLIITDRAVPPISCSRGPAAAALPSSNKNDHQYLPSEGSCMRAARLTSSFHATSGNKRLR